ncbi:anterior gradient protein 2 homolog [Cheilinus undulatus]|uniref:anterior gradient protein 2 homolog n=1 Tax=Cheilinus undulatus TaxID=241271 RepID=UPI001BD24339|nr:anterior gradient protein 2 homolog [Cheilinus undulatus]
MMIRAVLSFLVLLGAVSSVFAAGKKGEKEREDRKYIPKTGKRVPQMMHRGWGDQLIWAQTYEEALYWARKAGKPLMVIFHLDECKHSQALKKVFADNQKIQKTLDEDFIVLNLVYETTDKHLSPDGQYVPRIIFVDPSMTVRADIAGRYSNRLYAYEPQDENLLLENMDKAKKLLKDEL